MQETFRPDNEYKNTFVYIPTLSPINDKPINYNEKKNGEIDLAKCFQLKISPRFKAAHFPNSEEQTETTLKTPEEIEKELNSQKQISLLMAKKVEALETELQNKLNSKLEQNRLKLENENSALYSSGAQIWKKPENGSTKNFWANMVQQCTPKQTKVETPSNKFRDQASPLSSVRKNTDCSMVSEVQRNISLLGEPARKDITPLRLSKMREDEAAEAFETRKKKLYMELHSLSSKKSSANKSSYIAATPERRNTNCHEFIIYNPQPKQKGSGSKSTPFRQQNKSTANLNFSREDNASNITSNASALNISGILIKEGNCSNSPLTILKKMWSKNEEKENQFLSPFIEGENFQNKKLSSSGVKLKCFKSVPILNKSTKHDAKEMDKAKGKHLTPSPVQGSFVSKIIKNSIQKLVKPRQAQVCTSSKLPVGPDAEKPNLNERSPYRAITEKIEQKLTKKYSERAQKEEVGTSVLLIKGRSESREKKIKNEPINRESGIVLDSDRKSIKSSNTRQYSDLRRNICTPKNYDNADKADDTGLVLKFDLTKKNVDKSIEPRDGNKTPSRIIEERTSSGNFFSASRQSSNSSYKQDSNKKQRKKENPLNKFLEKYVTNKEIIVNDISTKKRASNISNLDESRQLYIKLESRKRSFDKSRKSIENSDIRKLDNTDTSLCQQPSSNTNDCAEKGRLLEGIDATIKMFTELRNNMISNQDNWDNKISESIPHYKKLMKSILQDPSTNRSRSSQKGNKGLKPHRDLNASSQNMSTIAKDYSSPNLDCSTREKQEIHKGPEGYSYQSQILNEYSKKGSTNGKLFKYEALIEKELMTLK